MYSCLCTNFVKGNNHYIILTLLHHYYIIINFISCRGIQVVYQLHAHTYAPSLSLFLTLSLSFSLSLSHSLFLSHTHTHTHIHTFSQWFFVGIAGVSALLYTLIFLTSTAKVYWGLRKKQKELASLSPSAQESFQGLFFRLKFFLLMTVLVAMCSIGTVVLPTEIMLHQWQHGSNDYAIYSKSFVSACTCELCIVR